LIALLLAFAATSCVRSSRSDLKKPASITVLMWTSAPTRAIDRKLMSEFTSQTGITVELVPAPESSWRRLQDELESAPTGLDVIEFDLAWSSHLRSRLSDVRDALVGRINDELPGTVDSVV